LAHAAQPEGQLSVTPVVVFTDGDKARLVDDEINGYGLSLSKAFAPNWSFEGVIRNIDFSGVADQDELFIGADIMRVFNRNGVITPYFLLGAGYLKNTSAGLPARNNAEASAGFGLLMGKPGKPNVRLQYRTRRDGDSASLRDQLVSLGLQIPIGSPAPVIGDTDGDGVPDDRDRCPRTPRDRPVDEFGCQLDADADGVVDGQDQCPDTPRGVGVDARGCALDSDGDGVPDGQDRCPSTVTGARVDSNGCELDSDGDGIVDRLDQCPNTTAGVAVDIRGCEIKDEIRLPGVNFETNSDRLIGSTTGVLDDAAATLQKNPQLRVEVAGHTDSQGAAEYNQNLSERRAIAVRDYLVAQGVVGANLSIRGYGESEPIADNGSAAGRAANRRVVLRILE
jgi:OOP family OmpA-OmpF porin